MHLRDHKCATESAIEWYRALGALIDQSQAKDLPGRLVHALARLVPFELAAVFDYCGPSRPVNV